MNITLHFLDLHFLCHFIVLLLGHTRSFCDSSEFDLILSTLPSATFLTPQLTIFSTCPMKIHWGAPASAYSLSNSYLPFRDVPPYPLSLVSLKALSDRFCRDPYENAKTLYQLDHPYSEMADLYKELLCVSQVGLPFTEVILTHQR